MASEYLCKMEKEIWKKIIGYEDYYEISNLGRIRSFDRMVKDKNHYRFKKGRVLKGILAGNGYLYLHLKAPDKDKRTTFHSLVAQMFLGHMPNGYKTVIDHIDFDRLNNAAINLRITSVRENTNQKHLKSASPYTGAYLNKKTTRWYSQIRIGKTKKHLGCFATDKEAGEAYQKALDEIIFN